VCIEFVAQVFPSQLECNHLTRAPMLCPQPGLQSEVCLVSFAFECKEVNTCVACFVVGEADIIQLPN